MFMCFIHSDCCLLQCDLPPQVVGGCTVAAGWGGINTSRRPQPERACSSQPRRLRPSAPTPLPKYHTRAQVMACPGGCIGGGGQPKTHDPDAVLKRMGAIYAVRWVNS